MRRWTARRAARACAVVMLGGCAPLLAPAAAHASGPVAVKTPLLQQAWFWQNAYEQANPPVAEPAPATEPTGVPAGDLAVAYTGSTDKSSSKMAALSFQLGTVAPGTAVQAFTFSLTLDPSAAATTFNSAEATIVACQPTRLWPAEQGGDYSNEPTVDCSKKVVPTVNGSTYTFKIPAIAQSWVDDQNLGVAIVADPDKTVAPFQVVFASAKSSSGSLVYLPAVTTSGSGSGAPPPATGPTGGGSSTTSTGSTGPTTQVPLPPTDTGTTTTAPAPVVAPSPPVPAAVQTRPVAAAKAAPALPTGAFWIAGVLLAALILLASLVLGDPAPVARTAAPSRLDRVLRERRTDLLSARSL